MSQRKKPSFAKLPTVEVEWVDSCCSNGWGEHKNDVGVAHCRTAGYLVSRDKTQVRVALSQGEDGISSLGDVISIPAVAVKRVRRLR